jgi:hypothetical protein
VQAAEDAGRVSDYERHDRAAGIVHRFRFVNDVPLNASRADVRVNVIEYWESGKERVQHFSWVTDLRVSKRHVYQLMRAGRARWKMENETCNTLKNQGDNFAHNYGHGEQNLSVVFAQVMLLAFLVDQAQQLCWALFRAVWTKLGSKRLLWERMRALFYDYRLESMRELLEALFYGFEKSRPLLITDTSSIPFMALMSRCWSARRSPIATGVVCPNHQRCRFLDRHGTCFAHHLTRMKPKRMIKLTHWHRRKMS